MRPLQATELRLELPHAGVGDRTDECGQLDRRPDACIGFELFRQPLLDRPHDLHHLDGPNEAADVTRQNPLVAP
jgi:hypothetical protein